MATVHYPKRWIDAIKAAMPNHGAVERINVSRILWHDDCYKNKDGFTIPNPHQYGAGVADIGQTVANMAVVLYTELPDTSAAPPEDKDDSAEEIVQALGEAVNLGKLGRKRDRLMLDISKLKVTKFELLRQLAGVTLQIAEFDVDLAKTSLSMAVARRQAKREGDE